MSLINAKKSLIKVCRNAIREEAKKITELVSMKYNAMNTKLGNAEISFIEEKTDEVLTFIFLGKGQKALIAEYGKGSLMDRDNPALERYLNNDDIFNKERLKHNLAIVTRINDDSYSDLDGKTYTRPRPKVLKNLENTGKDEYKPIAPQYIIFSTIQDNFNKILNNIATSVATEFALEELFKGRRFRCKV